MFAAKDVAPWLTFNGNSRNMPDHVNGDSTPMKKRHSHRSKPLLTPRVIKKGDAPPCLRNGCQCRGCFGWQNMLNAAESRPTWRAYPLCCQMTGLTLKF
jgi:hypothetical protein